MARVPSGSSIYSIAYLTETGRKYLFGKDGAGTPIRFNADGSDNFEIRSFALYDSDRNYQTTALLEAGDLPDMAGTSDNTCLKTSADASGRMKVGFKGAIPVTAQAGVVIEYTVSVNPLVIDINSI